MKEAEEPLRYSLQTLASACDGASTRDNVGFNRYDAQLGRLLAGIPESQWSPKDARWAYWTLKKYRKQLLNYGIEWEKLPRPKEEKVVEKVDLNSVGKW